MFHGIFFFIRLKSIKISFFPMTERLRHSSPSTCCALISSPTPLLPSLLSLPSRHTVLFAVPPTYGCHLRAFAQAVLLPGSLFPRIAGWDVPSLPTDCSNVTSRKPILAIPFKIPTSSIPPTPFHPALFIPFKHAT